MKLTSLLGPAVFALGLLGSASATAQAQPVLGQKSTAPVCLPVSLTGLAACVEVQQSQHLRTPAGNETAVWKGQVPPAQRPAQVVIKDATWEEQGRTFQTHTVINPSGQISITLQYRPAR